MSTTVNIAPVIDVILSETFTKWLGRLRDPKARVRIEVRLERLSLGNLGDVKPIGGGLSETRIDYGPGYRVYFMQRGPVLIVVLAGGDKTTQQRDIAKAIQIAQEWRD